MNETVSSSGEESPLAKNLKSKSIWMRLLFMLVVTFLYSVSRIVVGAVVIVQFFWVLFTGETNQKLQVFGKSLATYTNQIILYLTFNTEARPFPFDIDWPN
ncbi:MAG: DUF4389 domain-containing protein [Gammaproteobacteria bacterium]